MLYHILVNTVIDGDIHSDGSLLIDGRLKGEIICNGDLILGETSKVYGKIERGMYWYLDIIKAQLNRLRV